MKWGIRKSRSSSGRKSKSSKSASTDSNKKLSFSQRRRLKRHMKTMSKLSKRDIERMNTASHLDKLSSRELQKKIDRWSKEDRVREMAYANYNRLEKERKDRLVKAARAGLAIANEVDYSKFLSERIDRRGFQAGPEGDKQYEDAVEGMKYAGQIVKGIVKTGVNAYNAYNTTGAIKDTKDGKKNKKIKISHGGMTLDKDQIYIPGLHNPDFSLMHSSEIDYDDTLQHAKWSEFKKNLVSQARKAGKSVYEMFPQYYSSTAKYVQNAKANFKGYARSANAAAKNVAARAAYGNNSMAARASWNNIGNRVKSNVKRAAINKVYSKNAGVRKASRDAQAGVTAKAILKTAGNRASSAAKRLSKKASNAAVDALKKGGPQAAAAARDMLKKGAKFTKNAYKDGKKAVSRAARDGKKTLDRAVKDGTKLAKRATRDLKKKVKRGIRDASTWMEYKDKNIQRFKEDFVQNAGYNIEKAVATIANGGSLSKKQQKELEKKYGKDWWTELKKSGSRAVEDIQDGSMVKKGKNKASDFVEDTVDKTKDKGGDFFTEIGRKLQDAHQAGKDAMQDYSDFVKGDTNKNITKERAKTAEKAKKKGTVVESSVQNTPSPGNSAGINPVTGLPYDNNSGSGKKKKLKQSDVYIPGQFGLAQDILMHGYSTK